VNCQFCYDGITPVEINTGITKLKKGEVHRYHRRMSRI
jgi:hypothetical protein